MTCFGPLPAYRPRVKDGGDRRLVFDKRKSETGIRILIPCGQCAGCRLEKSRQWAMRCMHEKQMHSGSSFITLTYSDENMPEGGSLCMDDYQRFMKRLRKRFGNGIRFCGCGEYGDTTFRPHYHILLLSHDFPDRKFIKSAPSGLPLYSSKILDELWGLGMANIGNVDFDSCAYVARYVMKKIVGTDTYDSNLYDPETGIVKEPQFMTMSRRPGLGSSWYEKYGPHAYVWDSVVFKGVEVPPPRFYDSKRIGPLINERLKVKRRRKAMLKRADNTLTRLRVREVVALAKLKLKGRSL